MIDGQTQTRPPQDAARPRTDGLETVEATLSEDARIDRRLGRATQIRMQGIDAEGKPVRISHKVAGNPSDADLERTTGRLRTGTPMEAEGRWIRSKDGVRTMDAASVAERPMHGEDAGPDLARLGPETAAAAKRKRERKASQPSLIRQGAAQVLATAMSHQHHESEPEHLAAIQKHASTFIGAIRSAGGATKQAFSRNSAKDAASRKQAGAGRGFQGVKRAPAADRRAGAGREL